MGEPEQKGEVEEEQASRPARQSHQSRSNLFSSSTHTQIFFFSLTGLSFSSQLLDEPFLSLSHKTKNPFSTQGYYNLKRK